MMVTLDRVIEAMRLDREAWAVHVSGNTGQGMSPAHQLANGLLSGVVCVLVFRDWVLPFIWFGAVCLFVYMIFVVKPETVPLCAGCESGDHKERYDHSSSHLTQAEQDAGLDGK